MKISIVTAVYNRVDCIRRAVDSVNHQTWGDIQHVVVDGASTDGTRELLKTILPATALFISEPDRGIYDAINKGISRSDGDVIGLLHSDDVFADAQVLSKVALAFEQDPSLDMLYGDIDFYDAAQPGRRTRVYSSRRFTPERLASGWMPAHTSVFLRRRVFERHGLYRTDYRIAGDFEYMARIFRDRKIKTLYLPEIMVHMRTGGASTAGWRSTLTLNREVLRACRENGIRTSWLRLLSRYPEKLLEFALARQQRSRPWPSSSR